MNCFSVLTGSHSSWQNWTVATKLTIGVDGKRKALKSALSALVACSNSRAGKISSLTGQPASSMRFISSPLSVLASRRRANRPNAESWSTEARLHRDEVLIVAARCDAPDQFLSEAVGPLQAPPWMPSRRSHGPLSSEPPASGPCWSRCWCPLAGREP